MGEVLAALIRLLVLVARSCSYLMQLAAAALKLELITLSVAELPSLALFQQW